MHQSRFFRGITLVQLLQRFINLLQERLYLTPQIELNDHSNSKRKLLDYF